MVHVRLSDPMLNGDVYAYLAGTLRARVREVGNVLTVDFIGGPADTAAQVRAVQRITTAWRAAGHLDVRAEVLAA
jgi:hypothetical protein